MHPFQSTAGGAIDLGKQNKSTTLSVLSNYIRKLSNNKFRAGKLREFGLLINRKVRCVSTSPDGIVPLYISDNETRRSKNSDY